MKKREKKINQWKFIKEEDYCESNFNRNLCTKKQLEITKKAIGGGRAVLKSDSKDSESTVRGVLMKELL